MTGLHVVSFRISCPSILVFGSRFVSAFAGLRLFRFVDLLTLSRVQINFVTLQSSGKHGNVLRDEFLISCKKIGLLKDPKNHKKKEKMKNMCIKKKRCKLLNYMFVMFIIVFKFVNRVAISRRDGTLCCWYADGSRFSFSCWCGWCERADAEVIWCRGDVDDDEIVDVLFISSSINK